MASAFPTASPATFDLPWNQEVEFVEKCKSSTIPNTNTNDASAEIENENGSVPDISGNIDIDLFTDLFTNPNANAEDDSDKIEDGLVPDISGDLDKELFEMASKSD